MNRILTLTTGGLFAAMAILPAVAFAQTGTVPGKDTKAPTAMTTMQTDSKTATPSNETKSDVKGHAAEAKTEAKAPAVKHDGSVKTPEAHSSVQPKPAEQPNKS